MEKWYLAAAFRTDRFGSTQRWGHRRPLLSKTLWKEEILLKQPVIVSGDKTAHRFTGCNITTNTVAPRRSGSVTAPLTKKRKDSTLGPTAECLAIEAIILNLPLFRTSRSSRFRRRAG
ncbi:unnamed protein product [Citrullus colocynthis]|uniref:Uncharacterized protein n=1 Tax=Citrullus colocynthis TaxID=252529 RepID=A0ABP0Z329_9ROSI